MALTGLQNMSNFDKVLKYTYLPKMLSTINVARVLMNRVRRDMKKRDSTGKSSLVPVNIRPSEALGATTDGGALPTAQFQRFVETTVAHAYNYGTIRLTHPTIQASRRDETAFMRVVGAEMDGIRRDLMNDQNRQLFGYGAGVIGRVNGATTAASTTVILDSGHQVKVNMVVDIGNSTAGGTLSNTSKTVSTVTGSTTIIITALGTNVVDNAYVYRAGSMSNEMMGLMGIVDDATFVSTFQGISRSTYASEWSGQVLSNSGTGRSITTTLLDQILMDCRADGEGNPTMMITSPIQWRLIGEKLTAIRRYTDTQTLHGGFQAIDWSGVPIFWDNQCPRSPDNLDSLFCLDESTLAMYQLADWDFIDDDGSILKWVSGYAAFDATLFHYANFGCTQPKANGVIRDLDLS